MPPSVEDRLRDILEAIAEIDSLLEGIVLERFSADMTRRMATERFSKSSAKPRETYQTRSKTVRQTLIGAG